VSVSLWQRLGDAGLEPGRFDLAIIGGGISGIAAAIECESRGLRAVILERHTLGSGASGRNAGYLMRGMADTYAVAVRTLGRDVARAVWELSEQNLVALKAQGIERAAGFAHRPSCLLALNESDEADLRQSHEMLLEDGFASELLEANEIPEPVGSRANARAGLVNPNDAICDPVAMLAVLSAKLKTTRIIENCEVCALEPENEGVCVRTRLGVIRADRVMVCANAWAGELLPEMRSVIVPARGQMLAARPAQPIELKHAYYINRGDEYLRSAPDGLLLMGGARRFEPEDQKGDQSGTAPEVQSVLEDYLRTLVTERYEVVARWSGVMGLSPDGLPIAGPVVGLSHVWVCAGFSGHGMSLAYTVARRTAEAFLTGQSEFSAFSPARLAR